MVSAINIFSGGLLTRIRLTIFLLFAALFSSTTRAQFPPAPGTGPGLPETIEAIDAARVTTRILYITAHPDDESAAVLTYLARGLHADVALLSITRGEGGQNALGPEQAPQLGLIRTQELLAATRGYGVKLYFTRAKDFGYSKTPEETEKIWGDAVLEDMVRVIREFRPNIVINGWGGVHSGHGHHQLSGIWTPKAVKLAADLKYLADANFPVWDSDGHGVQIMDVERGSDNPKGYVLPVDDVSPLYGKSWREIGIDAFSNHRSQGISAFLSSPFLRRPLALLPEDGSMLDPHALAVPLSELLGPVDGKVCKTHPEACEKLKKTDATMVEARSRSLSLDWPAATQLLLSAQKSLASLSPPDSMSSYGPLGRVAETDVSIQVGRISQALLLAAGFEFYAAAETGDVVMNEPFTVTVTYHCRQEVNCPVQGPAKIWANSKEFAASEGDPVKGLKFSVVIDGPLPSPSASEQLRPEPWPLVSAALNDPIGENHSDPVTTTVLPVTTIVLHVAATSTNVTRVPVRLVPAYTLAVEPRQAVAVLGQPRKPFDILLRVHSYSTKPATVSIGLDVPDGLQASTPVEVHFDGVGDQYAKLTVTPPAQLAAGNYTITAYAKRGDEKFSTSLEPLPTMPSILWGEPAQTIVHAFDINVPSSLRVGYITAEGEMIPEALKRLGINVEMLDANALTFGDLSKYTAIVVGVRAYELRPELASANKRLLDYVTNGGTLVVQYNRDFIWNKFLPAPYHATIGNPTPRITDENAEVKFLKPDDPLLNTPNKITAADFQNWVQERGLYYWSDFDAKYTPLLSMHDPGESDLNGGLVYSHLGKGVYIYTGLAFFRELPEGVPGAYRLFVNLLGASQSAH
jgi:LmbE family N-acetylglucosaminyl deacetylase